MARQRSRLAELFLQLLLLSNTVSCYPSWRNAVHKRQSIELNATYDYVVIGGGQSGLTVADRLSEDSTSTSPFPYVISELHCVPS